MLSGSEVPKIASDKTPQVVSDFDVAMPGNVTVSAHASPAFAVTSPIARNGESNVLLKESAVSLAFLRNQIQSK